MRSGRYYERPDSASESRQSKNSNLSLFGEAEEQVRSAANMVKIKSMPRSSGKGNSGDDEKVLAKDFLTEEELVEKKSGRWRWGWWSLMVVGIVLAGIVIVVICKMLVWNKDSSTNNVSSNSTMTTSPAVTRLCKFTENPGVCELTLMSQPGASTASDEALVAMVVTVAQGIVAAARGLFQNIDQTEPDNGTFKGVAHGCSAMLDDADDFLNATLAGVQGLLQGSEESGTFDDVMQQLSAAVTLNDDCLTELQPFANSTDPRLVTAYNQVKNGDLMLFNAFSMINHLPNISAVIADFLRSADQALNENGTVANVLSQLPPLTLADIPDGRDAIDPFNNASDSNSDRRRRQLLWTDDLSEEEAQIPSWARRGLTELTAARPDVIVDKSGKGDYTTIQAAVDNAPVKGKERYNIKINEGIYREQVTIPKGKDCITFVGDGLDKTFIVAGYSVVGYGITTMYTATLGVAGKEFWMMGVAVINTAGPAGEQAVAFRDASDLSVIYNCSFLAYQDTLYVHVGRQYYRSVVVEGTVDFIFGNAACILHKSSINVRWNGRTQETATVTAQGRMIKGQPTGIVLIGCNIRLKKRLLQRTRKDPVAFRTFLGRPWKEYSATVYINCFLQEGIDPQGWLDWNGVVYLTVEYYEYGSFGKGSAIDKRVPWSKQISLVQARAYSLQRFLGASSWVPRTGVPYS